MIDVQFNENWNRRRGFTPFLTRSAGEKHLSKPDELIRLLFSPRKSVVISAVLHETFRFL